MGKRSTSKPVQSLRTAAMPGRDELHSAVRSKIGSRLLPLTLAAILGACAIIAAVVIMTPMPDGDAAQNGEERRISQEAIADTQPIVELPRIAKDIDVEQLQDKLRELAEQMPQRYPQDPAAYHFAAQIYAELKQSQPAEVLWKKCLAMNPQHVGPYVGLSEILMAGGRDEEAMTLLVQAKQSLAVSPDLLLKLGAAQENLGELAEAQKAYQECTERFPQLGEAWLALGRILNQQSQFPEAESCLRKSIAINGPTEPSLFALTNSLVRQSKSEEAAKIREQVVALQAQSTSGDNSFQEQYDATLRRIAASMLVTAAVLEEEHGELAEAGEYCLQAISIAPLHLQAYVTLSSIYRKAERFFDALIIQRRLLELQPGNLLNYINLASVQLLVGDADGAQATLRQGIARDPQGTVAQAALARLYLASGNMSQAHTLAQGIVDRAPTVDAYELLAAVFSAADNEIMAKAAIEKAEQLKQTTTK